MTAKLPYNPHKFSDFFTSSAPYWLTTFALARGMTESARLFRAGSIRVLTLSSNVTGKLFKLDACDERGVEYYDTVVEARNAFHSRLTPDEWTDWVRLRRDLYESDKGE